MRRRRRAGALLTSSRASYGHGRGKGRLAEFVLGVEGLVPIRRWLFAAPESNVSLKGSRWTMYEREARIARHPQRGSGLTCEKLEVSLEARTAMAQDHRRAGRSDDLAPALRCLHVAGRSDREKGRHAPGPPLVRSGGALRPR